MLKFRSDSVLTISKMSSMLEAKPILSFKPGARKSKKYHTETKRSMFMAIIEQNLYYFPEQYWVKCSYEIGSKSNVFFC